jgi:hypothetical protein
MWEDQYHIKHYLFQSSEVFHGCAGRVPGRYSGWRYVRILRNSEFTPRTPCFVNASILASHRNIQLCKSRIPCNRAVTCIV